MILSIAIQDQISQLKKIFKKNKYLYFKFYFEFYDGTNYFLFVLFLRNSFTILKKIFN